MIEEWVPNDRKFLVSVLKNLSLGEFLQVSSGATWLSTFTWVPLRTGHGTHLCLKHSPLEYSLGIAGGGRQKIFCQARSTEDKELVLP